MAVDNGAGRSTAPPQASPPQASPPQRASLPAPYRNPWRALAEDLRAVLADLRLRSRALVRRNGEGELWRPRWWPRDLAPLFWPLLALLLLGLLVLAPLLVRRATSPAPVPALETPAPSAATPLPPASPAVPAPPLPSPPPSSAPLAAPSPPDALADAAPPAAQAGASVAAPPAAEADASAAPAPDPLPDPPDDPLQAWLSGDDRGWIAAAEPQPSRGTLQLRLTSAFAQQPAAARQRLAERWFRQAAELGYDHLELRASGSGLIGRDALVGSGMILFSEQPPS